MTSAESAKQPLEVPMEFIKRINSGDANSVCELIRTTEAPHES